MALDERLYSLDAGVNAWFTDRWGLGMWGMWGGVAGSDTPFTVFTPAVRYQHPLRRRRSLHVGMGLWHVEQGEDFPVVLPYVDVLYGVPAPNRRFGMRAGLRLIGLVPMVVVTGSYTSN